MQARTKAALLVHATHMQPNERTTTAGNRIRNKFLLTLSDQEYALIRPHLESPSMPAAGL